MDSPSDTLWQPQCKSWFKRNQDEGRIVGLWPGSSVHAQLALQSPRFEDFTYVHLPTARDNILCFLGNGLTMAQKEEGNTTKYLDMVDVPPTINSGPRPLSKGKSSNDDDGEEHKVTDLSASATNLLGNGSKVKGNTVHVEDVLVERVSAMSV
jgi:hypothetical protein